MDKNLNKLLSDFVVMYHKLQNFHWYVKGKDFFTAHAKLEELYDEMNEGVDDVAELILMLGGSPKASLKDFLAEASIQEAKMEHKKSKDVYGEVLADYEYLLKSVKEIKRQSEEQEVDVVGVHMDDYIKNFTKTIWMIKQVVEVE